MFSPSGDRQAEELISGYPRSVPRDSLSVFLIYWIHHQECFNFLQTKRGRWSRPSAITHPSHTQPTKGVRAENLIYFYCWIHSIPFCILNLHCYTFLRTPKGIFIYFHCWIPEKGHLNYSRLDPAANTFHIFHIPTFHFPAGPPKRNISFFITARSEIKLFHLFSPLEN